MKMDAFDLILELHRADLESRLGAVAASAPTERMLKIALLTRLLGLSEADARRTVLEVRRRATAPVPSKKSTLDAVRRAYADDCPEFRILMQA